MSSVPQVQDDFRATSTSKLSKPKLSAYQITSHMVNGGLTQAWTDRTVSGVLSQLLRPYYQLAENMDNNDFRDPLVVIGQTEMLRRFLNGGKGIPQTSLDNLLCSMIDTGSLAGVDICMEAGADPDVVHEHEGSSARDKAESNQRQDMMAVIEAHSPASPTLATHFGFAKPTVVAP